MTDFWDTTLRILGHKAERHAIRQERVRRMFEEPCSHPG
jgi:hypothetical protein